VDPVGRFLVKLDDSYLEWSTISDGPCTYGMTLDELREYVRAEQGNEGLRELPRRLARVEAKGTSAFDAENADDVIWLNRAGPQETPLHREEIIEFYVRRKEPPTAETLSAFRTGLARCGTACPQRIDKDYGAWCERCWGTDYVRALSVQGE
jgi:hypothetical protein